MICYSEILGVKKLALYVNKGVKYRWPDASKETEIDLIAHAVGSIVIDDHNEYPRWFRANIRMDSGKIGYIDKFTFNLHGIFNDTPAIIENIINNRDGYIVELITTSGKSFVFPCPVIAKKDIEQPENEHSHEIELTYKVPTPYNYYTKLNDLLMIHSYILVYDNQILGTADGRPIINS